MDNNCLIILIFDRPSWKNVIRISAAGDHLSEMVIDGLVAVFPGAPDR
jgi:hypothetical protein